MIAVGLIPPCARPFEAHMGNKLMGWLNAPAAQRISASALGAGGEAMPMGVQILLEVGQRRRRRVARRLQVLQIPEHPCYLPDTEADHQRLRPFLGLL